jgi:hypothetical protein
VTLPEAEIIKRLAALAGQVGVDLARLPAPVTIDLEAAE